MTKNEILTKIEDALGYVEMGKKSPNERVNAILAEIDKMKESHPVETTVRDEAIQNISALYPTDSEYPNTNEVGKNLLEEARRLAGSPRTWRDEKTEVLVRYAELCRGYDHKQYQKHLALMPDLGKL